LDLHESLDGLRERFSNGVGSGGGLSNFGLNISGEPGSDFSDVVVEFSNECLDGIGKLVLLMSIVATGVVELFL
jgi:hypothetical protein